MPTTAGVRAREFIPKSRRHWQLALLLVATGDRLPTCCKPARVDNAIAAGAVGGEGLKES